MIVAAGPDTAVLTFGTLLAIAGALGVSYAVFRTSADQKKRELDKELDTELIVSQERLIAFKNAEVLHLTTENARLISDLATYKTLEERITQRADVDKLRSELQEIGKAHEMLLRDIIGQLRDKRGAIG